MMLLVAMAAMASAWGAPAEETVFSETFEGETAKRWRFNKSVWSVREGAGRLGSRALVYDRNETNAAVKSDSPFASVPLQPGESYRISGYFRGNTSDGRDPCLVLECYDKAGRRTSYGTKIIPNNAIDGMGKQAEMGWTRLELDTPFISPQTSGCFLTVRFPGVFRKTAIFDDIEIVRVDRPPVTTLHSSAYRDRESEGPVTFVTDCHVRPGVNPRPVFTFRAPGGETVRREAAIDAAGEIRLTVDVSEMAAGANDVVLSLETAGGCLAAVTNHFFRGERGERRPRVWTDRFGRAIVGGKPFFPIGMESTVRPDGAQLEHYAAGPFNCIRTLNVPTVEQLDKYYARGIMWIAGLQNYYYGTGRKSRFNSREEVRAELRRVIATCKDHPATLAWLTNDEMPIANVPDAEENYRFFRALDPDHPVRCCIDQPQNIRAFMNSCDTACTDPYPIGNWGKRPISLAGEWTRITRRQSFGIRSVWQVVQAFNWAWYRPNESPEGLSSANAHMPTVEEMRSMSWQCIAEGANGLLWYAYNCYVPPYGRFVKSQEEGEQCWRDVCTVASEVRRFSDMMLSVEPAPAASCDTPNALWRIWQYEGATWLLVCNPERRDLAARFSFKDAAFAHGASALGEASPGIEGANVSLALKPLAVSLVRLNSAH